jgi:molecular chaperone GrpE
VSDPDRPHDELPEGWESLAEEAEGGSLAPSAELEEALREAAEAVEAREAERHRGHKAPGAQDAAGEIEALRAENAQLKERMIRLQADFENHRRRALKEREEAHRYGHENLVKDLLATVDNLDRAIEHARRNDGADFEGMLQGVDLVRRELLGALAKYGLSEVEAEGAAFDPNVHEALAQVENDEVAPGTIVEVLQKGYRLRDRLLRPTRVVVSKRSAGDGKPSEGDGS